MSQIKPSNLFIGIDIGGTFTDFVVYHSELGDMNSFKLFSTPSNPALAVNQGLDRIIESEIKNGRDVSTDIIITHGSTVATNALLERHGARTALITTKGFNDVIEIGRQNRPSLYDFSAQPPKPLVPASLRLEVSERIDHNGKIVISLNQDELPKIATKLHEKSVESVAICLLFSFLYPDHEKMISDSLQKLDVYVSKSSEILPEYREYERTSTTVINAYVTPVLDRYLAFLEESVSLNLKNASIRIMQSNGGIISIEEARRVGIKCILSGPAGGVVGAGHIASKIQLSQKQENIDDNLRNELRVITFDMGGTSTDVSLIDDRPIVTNESTIGGFPIRIPVLDIHTIGAGGGSIASVDIGGALRVGPESTGAEPGPACYARGDKSEDQPTVTDANLILGRLPADHFLGGEMILDTNRAENIMSKLGSNAGLTSLQSAFGVIDVVNANMERALRLISVERGYDPKEFGLLSFGGAGGLHACNLARRLGIPKVFVPPIASTLSAYGMLVADVVKDYSKTVMLPGKVNHEQVLESLKPLVEQGQTDIISEGFEKKNIGLERLLDMRYQGQSYELTLPFRESFIEDFHNIHQQTYGYSRRDSPVEIVNVRVRAIGNVPPPLIPKYPVMDKEPTQAFIEKRLVHLNRGQAEVPLYQGELLNPGNGSAGPAVIVRKDTTVFLDEGDDWEVDQHNNLIISIN